MKIWGNLLKYIWRSGLLCLLLLVPLIVVPPIASVSSAIIPSTGMVPEIEGLAGGNETFLSSQSAAGEGGTITDTKKIEPFEQSSVLSPEPMGGVSGVDGVPPRRSDRAWFAVGSQAYSIEPLADYFTGFDLDAPETLPNLGSFGDTVYGADLALDHSVIYAINSSSNNFVLIDPADGSQTVVGPISAINSQLWSGVATDPTNGTVYASSTGSSDGSCDTSSTSTLYTINLATGAATTIGQITNAPCLIAIAIDNTGQMWGYDIANDVLLSINKNSGAGTVIGSIGFDANYTQGLDYDSKSGQLYMAAYNNDTSRAELRTVDRSTGNTTLVGLLAPNGATNLSWLAIEEFSLAISDVAVDEGQGTMSFVVSLSVPSSDPVSVVYATSDNSAVAGSDYTATSGTLTIPAGQTSGTITVNITDDVIDENDETFFVTLSNPTNAQLTDAQGVGTILDNDMGGITVNPSSLTVSEPDGSDNFTIALLSQPTADVTIALSTSDSGECIVAPSVTLNDSNWNSGVNVTVSAVDDHIDDDTQSCLVQTAPATSSDSKYNGRNASDVSVSVQDDDTAGITVDPTSVTVSEPNSSSTFGIVLQSEPTADVTIALSSSDSGECAVTPGSVTLNSGNWNGGLNVTVSPVDDDLVDGDQTCIVQTAAASSSDSNYDGLDPSDVSVSVQDNDTAGITVDPTTLTVSEPDGSSTFVIALQSQPTANVTIALSSSDPGECAVTPASVTLNDGNWNSGVSVTVNPVDDSLADGDQPCTVQTGAASSSDSNYNGLNPADVNVTVQDDETVSIMVSPSSLTISEPNGSDTTTIKLNSPPTADVTIALTSSDTGECSVPPSVTLNQMNWERGVEVTISVVDDDYDNGNQTCIVQTAPASSSDSNYNGFNPADVNVTVQDDDTASIALNPTSLTVSEPNGSATFTVQLTSRPTGDVTIGLSSSDSGECAVTPPSVTLNGGNWNSGVNVTVSAVNDDIDDDTQSCIVQTAPASSSDSNYNGRNASDVSVSVPDDDTAGITVNPTSLTISEPNGSGSFTIALQSQPTANVTIALSSSDSGECVVPPSVTLNNNNWNSGVNVPLSAVDDNLADGDQLCIVEMASASSDSNYNGLDLAFTVTVQDDETAGITVDPTSLSVSEPNGSGTFTITLQSQPTADVTIGLSSSDRGECVTPASITLNNSNWNTGVNVTLSVVDDNIDDDTQSCIVQTAPASSSDSNYNGLDPEDVIVSVLDNDVSVVMSEVALEGPSVGGINTTYTFTATVRPANTTGPITYTWVAPEHKPIIHAEGGSVDSAIFSWNTPGPKEIMVKVSSSSGEVFDYHTIDLAVNAPPEARDVVIIPSEVMTYGLRVVPAGTNISVSYTYHDEENDPEAKEQTRIRWTRGDQMTQQEQPLLNDSRTVTGTLITIPQERWCATVTPHDGNSYGEPVQACAYIETLPDNLLPIAYNVEIPAYPSEDQPLQLISYQYTYVAGDAEHQIQLRWYRDDLLQPTLNDQLLVPAEATNVGQVWHVKLRVGDGTHFGPSVESNRAVISPKGNTLPIISNPRIVPTMPTASDHLTVTYGYIDADGDSEDQTQTIIRWLRDGQLQPQFNNQRSVDARFTIPGEKWRAMIQPHDGKNYGPFDTTPPVHVSEDQNNTPPEATEVKIRPAKPSAGQDLRLTYEFSDPDAGDVQENTIIRWYKWDGRLEVPQPMEKYNNLTVVPAAETLPSEVWYALVIPSDGQDYGPNVAAHSVTIGQANRPPQARNVLLAPAMPGDDEDLVVSYEYYDKNDDPEGPTEIKWTIDGLEKPALPYLNSTRISHRYTFVGQEWCAQVTPHDGSQPGEPVHSNCVTIAKAGQNSPPTISQLYISPAVPRSRDHLTLHYTYTDPDNDPEGHTIIRWYRNGKRFNSVYDNQTVIPASETSPGDVWTATAQPRDRNGMSGKVKSSPLMTINTAPQVLIVAMDPQEPVTSQDLTVSYEYEDQDNHPPSNPRIIWYKDGRPQPPFENQLIIPAEETSGGERWQATIYAFDGYEYSQKHRATEIRIGYRLYLPTIIR